MKRRSGCGEDLGAPDVSGGGVPRAGTARYLSTAVQARLRLAFARSTARRALPVLPALIVLLLPSARPGFAAEPVSLEAAIDRAPKHTARGQIIRGDVEVAQGLYQAQRVNFFLPSISIRGSLPSYEVDESYRFFGGSPRKRLYKTRGLGLTSFIQLEQNLLTGGKLDVKANLTANDDRYPDTDPSAVPGSFLLERSRRSYFDFSIQQPILKPSTPRHELANERDDLELARLNRREEEALLQREVTEAYLGLLQAQVAETTAVDRLESARLLADVDSSKWQDGVVAQEAWLATASKRLDAELSLREALQG
ncbi:MAG: TolC family protein, partial [Candidatus Eisenbacteria bacterium]|nr:TolC family protein [Candidatus Eisenbacteria bacterium]